MMLPKGEYDSGTSYQSLDIVTVTESNGTSAYIAKETISAGTPVSDSKWMKLFTVTNGTDGQDGSTGPAGSPGQDGADGQAATIQVGTVTTGDAGTEASVTNSGTANAAILNFVIPKGSDGAAGANGSDGADGAPGAAGADGKSVTAIALTFTKGEDGAITGGSGTATLSDRSSAPITITIS